MYRDLQKFDIRCRWGQTKGCDECMYGQCLCWRQGGREVKRFQTSVESLAAEMQYFKTCSCDMVFRCGQETKSCVWIERWKRSSNVRFLRPMQIGLGKIHSNWCVFFSLFCFIEFTWGNVLLYIKCRVKPLLCLHTAPATTATVAVLVTSRRRPTLVYTQKWSSTS